MHNSDMQQSSTTNLFTFIRAIIPRVLFILVSLIGVWRVTWVKQDLTYWFLTFLFLPLVVEMILTLKRRKGKDYKWISPPIFLFLLSIVPSIWILELHHRQDKNSDPMCNKLDSWDNVHRLVTQNLSLGNHTYQDYLRVLTSVCSNDWILALHQILLILVIVGKWLLPLGAGLTRDKLSQLLLIFVGTAADILEFTSETLSDIKENNSWLIYLILGVWTWSMAQFPLHVTVLNSQSGSEGVERVSSSDIWSIVEALIIQDGPFLVVRLIVIIVYKVFHQMLIFFTIKNLLVITLNFYRLIVLCQDFRPSGSITHSGSGVL